MEKTPSLLGALFWAAIAMAGCGGDDSSTPTCTPGASVACVGAGGCSGGQICLPDGTGFGPCDCGGGDDAGAVADAGGTVDAGDDGGATDGSAGGDASADAALPDPDSCDPVANTGCGPDEKCSWKVTSDTGDVGLTTCVPDGTVAVGDPCSSTDVAGGRSDDCVGGALCVAGVCSTTCDTTADACVDGVCQAFTSAFADRENVGACIPSCDVLAQDCSDAADGCYLSLADGDATCGPPAITSGTGEQGDDCIYNNGCTIGYGCNLVNDPVDPTGLVCAYYCDADGAGGPSCTDTEGPGAGYGCESLQDLYPDTPASIPARVGVCVACADYPSAPGCT